MKLKLKRRNKPEKPIEQKTESHETENSKPKLELEFENWISIPKDFLTDELYKQITSELTFKNPAYEKILQFSKYSYTNAPQTLSYFREDDTTLYVPYGYDVSFLASDFSLQASLNRVTASPKTLPPFILKLRDEQQVAVDAFLEQNKTDNPVSRNGLVCLPTGMGKTIVGLSIAHHLNLKTLVVVHKTDLVHGWQNDIKLAFGGKVKAGIIQAQKKQIGDFITVATVQTLGRLSAEELDNLRSQIGFVIQDECHHCPANEFQVVNNLNPLMKLGLTATPERGDGLAHIMKLYFGEFCYNYDDSNSTESDSILPVQVIREHFPVRLTPIVTLQPNNAYKLNESVLEKPVLKQNEKFITDIPYEKRPRVSHLLLEDAVLNHPSVVGALIKDLEQEVKAKHSCILFFRQVEHVDTFYNILCNSILKPSDVQKYYGATKNPSEVLRSVEAKETLVTLATLAKATEGTNCKAWEVAFFLSSIANGKDVQQAVGRIRRVSDKPKLNPVRVYDYCYDDVYMLRSHADKRLERYHKLGFEVIDDKPIKKVFSKGYR